LGHFGIYRDHTPELIRKIRKIWYQRMKKKSYYFLNLYNNKGNLKLINTNFAWYITGLLESNGRIVVPKTIWNSLQELNYPSIYIGFKEGNRHLALSIKKKLNNGKIIKTKGNNKYWLIINTYSGLILLIYILNGKMKTPQINNLNNLIDWINIMKDLNIRKKKIDKSCLSLNAWLSGFIDGNGFFFLRFRKTILSCGLEILVKCIDGQGYNWFEIMNQLSI